jgi:hypothetical protein
MDVAVGSGICDVGGGWFLGCVFIVSVLGQLVEMEQSGLDSEEFLEKLRQSTMKLREMEHNLLAAKKDVASYQDMLEQSQVS